MKDAHYISIICKTEADAEDNFWALHESLPGINLVDGLPGNELLIPCPEGNGLGYSLNQILEVLKGSVRVDMFELATDEKTGMQYRNWYYLPVQRTRRKTA